MASTSVSVLHVTLFVLAIHAVLSERMKSKIYDSVDGVSACFRRLNGTHQFGCTSHRLGNVGIVHIIEDDHDLTWLLNTGKAVPYMVVLYPYMFTSDVLVKLRDSGKINGIALLNNGTQLTRFTHEDTCPNRYSGLSSLDNQTCGDKDKDKPVWNPNGTKLLMMDWGFPIFYVQNDFEKIQKCYNRFNSEGRNEKHDTSLCAMEMNSFMFATVNSATCIRRSKMITNFNPMKFCDPLGGRNIWSTLFPRRKNASSTEQQNSTVYVVASRMDTSSLFDGIAPGAVSPVTGIVTLLATAYALSAMTKDAPPTNKNVLFVLFNGESFDYIGSSRMVWDMKKGRFPSEDDEAVTEQPPPLRLEHLAFFVELSHITNLYKDKNASTLVFHSPKKNSVQSHLSTESFIKNMEENGEKLGLKFQNRTDGILPPASLQTFIAHGGNTVVPGVVIADYYSSFKTSYYHSIYDEGKGINYEYQEGNVPPESIQGFVANVSIALANTLYSMLFDDRVSKPKPTVPTDVVNIVDELFHCYLDKTNCSTFQQASTNMILGDEAAPLYIGVNTWRGPNYLVTSLTGQTLAYLTGEQINKTEKECQNDPLQQIFQFIWMKGENSSGVCVKTTMNYSQALSPAFEETDYDWSSGLYSTWTESIWQELTVRIFLKPSPSHEVKVFSIGAVILGLSFIIVYFLNARSHIIFGNTLGSGAC